VGRRLSSFRVLGFIRLLDPMSYENICTGNFVENGVVSLGWACVQEKFVPLHGRTYRVVIFMSFTVSAVKVANFVLGIE
jgi:hypothetical protein